MALFAEMRRRNVIKVALLYAVLSWLIIWFVGTVQSEVSVPAWTETFMYFVLTVGFPVSLWFAWTYEITPVGLRRAADVDQTQSIVYKTGQKLNAALAVLIVLGVLAVFGQRLLPTFEFLVPGPPEGDAPVRATTPPEIRRLVLDNGLTVIAWPDHDIPNVALYIFVKAGGRNEYPGITGLSHFFEHMMFLGTENLEPGEFDKRMEAAGGANNAYTTNDVTVYTDWFPRSALKTIFELEADRFQNLQTYSDVVQSEREVVYSERRMRVDNNNDWKLMEQVFATAFVAHPYQFPVIGWPSDIEAWTAEDIIDNYPYSDYATLAELRIADAYYDQEHWEEALSYYRDFSELHPDHDRVPYTIYRAALAYTQAVGNGFGRDKFPVFPSNFKSEKIGTTVGGQQPAIRILELQTDR